MERFDLIAIGGGTAGLVTAAGGANLGLRVALVERERLGGDCLWTGCVPSKALIASARLAHAMRHADALGLTGCSPALAFERVMERMRAARALVGRHDDPERFRRLGVEVVSGHAELVGGGGVRVDGRVLESRRIVLATGALPAVPPIPGLAEAGFLTHQSAFEQESLPPRIAMLGGGPIGLELAQVYRRLGAAVTVLEMLPQLLPREEPDAAAVIRRALEDEGITVRTGARVERVEVLPSGAKAVHHRSPDGAAAVEEVDEVFVATGRRPATDGLGLEAAGVGLERGAGGAVRVDATLRTSAPGIWAAGDVAGGPQFTHVAEYHAKLVLRNAIVPLVRARVDYGAIPAVTYTDPEVARVGLTEQEAHERLGEVRTFGYSFADLDRAIVDGRAEGFVRVITRPNGRIVGATIVAAGAGELLMPLVLAMRSGIPLPRLSHVIYPYPTMAEGVKRTADNYYRERLAGRSGRWLRRTVRWLA
jgi:pyruvate/2-oxoglutarate dehydrogenase complex dihydrolipoamide dehydrogenase (E3) component